MSKTWAIGVVAVVVGIAGCGASGASCPAVTAEFAPTAASGEIIEVDLANVASGCNDQGGLAIPFLDNSASIELELVSVDTREQVLATGNSKVAKDGTEVVELTIPSNEVGTMSVVYDGVSLGTVTVAS